MDSTQLNEVNVTSANYWYNEESTLERIEARVMVQIVVERDGQGKDTRTKKSLAGLL